MPRRRKSATLPKVIKITYSDYSTIPMSAKQAEEEEIRGDVQFKSQEIRYDKSLTKDELVSTILHEVLHGIVHAYDVAISEKTEEKIVNVLANGLTTVFRDNPDLLEWVKGELK